MYLKYATIITGSIATGKSSVVNILKNRGYSVIDADKISHKIINTQSDAIAKMFGKEFIDKDGKVNRKRLGQVVFSCKQKREQLEKLLHVKIFQYINEKALSLEKKKEPYFIDIPLYFETNNVYNVAFVSVVYASKENQITRLAKRENISKEEAKKRVELQIDIEEKKRLADFVIDNTGDYHNLKQSTNNFIKQIEEKYANC